MTIQILSSVYTYTANIISYDATTKIATLDNPVNLSLGFNGVVGDTTSQYNIQGSQLNIASAKLNGGIHQLSTDEAGNFVGIFNVPSSTFQTGQRVFRVDNRVVQTDPTTATTYSEATFNSSGLLTKTSQSNYSPSVDSTSKTFTQVSQQNNQLTNTIVTQTPYDPLAQSFIISDQNFPNGVFIRSVKLFFNSVPMNTVNGVSVPSQSSKIKVSIVGTLNGYPNGQVLDYSTVLLNANQVITSSTPYYLDPTTYTEFMFQAPVFIQPNVLYAILIEADSPEYLLYVAQQNQLAIQSTSGPNTTNPTKIGNAPYVGSLFESQNAITWTADQSKDLMFVIDRCVFNTSVQPQIEFTVPRGLPYRKLGKDDIQYKNDPYSVSNLYGNYSSITPMSAFNTSTTDFIPSSLTSINYSYKATLAHDLSITSLTSVNPGKYGTPAPENTYLNDGLGSRILMQSSSNSFSLFATLSSTSPDVSPILSDDGISLYNIRYIINNMSLANSKIVLINGGTGYNVNTTSITVSAPDDSTGRQATLGYTSNNGTITSVYLQQHGSGYLTTPTITISDPTTRSGNSNAVVQIYGETSPNGGNSAAKYFTKKVVLSPGNDSGDLRVFYTAYKPVGSEVYIYYKILNRNDTQAFEQGNWQLMTQVTNSNVYSASRDNLIEYEWAPGVNNKANNYISYASTNGQTYKQFSQFAIKVVFRSNDRTSIPFLTDIRALALPSGTGL